MALVLENKVKQTNKPALVFFFYSTTLRPSVSKRSFRVSRSNAAKTMSDGDKVTRSRDFKARIQYFYIKTGKMLQHFSAKQEIVSLHLF